MECKKCKSKNVNLIKPGNKDILLNCNDCKHRGKMLDTENIRTAFAINDYYNCLLSATFVYGRIDIEMIDKMKCEKIEEYLNK